MMFLRRVLKITLVKRSYEFLKIFLGSNLKLKKILNLRSLVKRGPGLQIAHNFYPIQNQIIIYQKYGALD